MGITITQGDAVAWARNYSGPKFHAMLCDPPYHLTSIVKRYSKPDAKTENSIKRYGTQGVSPYMRGARGFMGKQWDGGDVAFDPATWDAFASVLYPGAFGMAFASSRGWHRLAVAIEDAGLIIHPSIFGWAYGSGFPKATRVDTQIDKAAGTEGGRGEITSKTGSRKNRVEALGFKENGGTSSVFTNDATENREYIAATDLAKAFAGYRYGLQALKPALEPIIVFQKPYEGRPIDNITQYGAGVLNIDGARIGTAEIPSNQWTDNAHPFGGGAGNEYQTVTNHGRWPSNFILLDDGAAQALDRQSGDCPVSGSARSGKPATGEYDNGMFGGMKGQGPLHNDSGGASRFFFQVQEAIDSSDPVYYCAKASTEERDAGLQEFEKKPLRESGNEWGAMSMWNGENGDEEWKKKNPNNPRHNPHPTVKPIALARYLATLLLPPTEYAPRRLFIPFAGVASECIGAMQAGWDEIQGVELTEEYIPIAQARVEYWRNRGWQLDMFANSLLQSDVDV